MGELYFCWLLACWFNNFPYNMKICQRKDKNPEDQSLGSRVTNNMVDVITANSSASLHQLHFDNFFTTCSLWLKLECVPLER